MVLAQTYRMQAGIGRLLRENVSELTLFKNRQEKQMDAIREELANIVPVELFDKAYNYATKEKIGSNK
jgi:DNA gyrase/topoisomerase IV subunit B